MTASGSPAVVIALLTDYGLSGPYVGAMKAVILSRNPAAIVFDISHDIAPQAVEEGAFVLAQVVPFLPKGAICVAVVDPGVGTERRAIALRTPRGTFIGPDNGLLSAALGDADRGPMTQDGVPTPVAVPAGALAVELANPSHFRQPVSTTFHGRDVFAPVAAHLSLGEPLKEFGPDLHQLNALPPWRAARQGDGSFTGRVIHVDHFGNLVTDIRAADLGTRRVQVEIAGRRLQGLQRTFQDGPEIVVYEGSSGFLEIARCNASAASALGVCPGDPIRLTAAG